MRLPVGTRRGNHIRNRMSTCRSCAFRRFRPQRHRSRRRTSSLHANARLRRRRLRTSSRPLCPRARLWLASACACLDWRDFPLWRKARVGANLNPENPDSDKGAPRSHFLTPLSSLLKSLPKARKRDLTPPIRMAILTTEISWWHERGGPTRSHPEHGSETL